jgi:hypothetical protein
MVGDNAEGRDQRCQDHAHPGRCPHSDDCARLQGNYTIPSSTCFWSDDAILEKAFGVARKVGE